MARTSSRSLPLLALCALAAAACALLCCGWSFVAVSSQRPGRQAAQGGFMAEARVGGTVAEQRTAMRFFSGEAEAPKPKKEKPFKTPPFFTTFVSLAVLVGGCAYFLNSA